MTTHSLQVYNDHIKTLEQRGEGLFDLNCIECGFLLTLKQPLVDAAEASMVRCPSCELGMHVERRMTSVNDVHVRVTAIKSMRRLRHPMSCQ